MSLLENTKLLLVVDRLAEESRARTTIVAQDQEQENWLPGYNIILCATLDQPQTGSPSTAGTPKNSA